MSATVIDGKAVAARVRGEIAQEVAALVERGDQAPGLATILVGDDPASAIYVAGKRKAVAEVGMADFHRHLPAQASQREVAEAIEEANCDPAISGILLQPPVSVGRLVKNTPGLRPCTPLGVIELLDSHGVELQGAEAVVVGRSDLVGKPVSLLLLHRNATVTICHSRTRDLAHVCARADVLIAAVGVAELIGAEYVRTGAAVIDVGINRTEDGLRGDVDFEAVAPKAGLITPVPGGVGPMTVAMLLRNTLAAARAGAAALPSGR
jgi:methylenetetrahydrofolate dehydrogenase (NADP+)/methenyltetrahydrofolate cyclohydrolase